MFLLIGLAILIGLALSYSAYKAVTVTDFKEKLDIVSFEVKRKSLDNYVDLCLREAVTQGLQMMAAKGGYLGLPNKQIALSTSGGTILRSIALERYERGSADFPDIPEYPTYTYSIFSKEPYPFGKKNFPYLCQKGGPNDALVMEYARPCPTGSYGNVTSIQKALNLYAASFLTKCVNLSEIQHTSGFDIEAEAPQVDVILGESGVMAQAKYLLKFIAEGQEATRLFEFDIEIPVRLKKIYGAAQDMINNDRFFIQYDKTKDYNATGWRSRYWDANMYVNVENDVDQQHSDILSITDVLSEIDGKPFTFYAGFDNRIPVLEPIGATPEDPNDVDIAVIEGSTITFNVSYADPDENEDLKVEFEGWKKDYSEWDCDNSPNGNSFNCNEQTSDYTVPRRQLEVDQDHFVYDNNTGIVKIKTFDPDNPDHYSDAGGHVLRVIVTDKHGLYDYQDVRILVAGSGEATAETGCYFPDEKYCEYYSVEDPIVLDASKSISSGSGARFDWKISPGGYSEDNVPILFTAPKERDIFDGIFGSSGGSVFPQPGIYSAVVNLATQSSTSSTPISLEVRECVPYLSTYTDPPMFPYNNTDPYLAAHRCCDTDGNYMPDTTVCYQNETFGSFVMFDNAIQGDETLDINDPSMFSLKWLEKAPSSQEDLTPPSGDEVENDIFRRKFVRYCSGDRGNVCIGKAEEIRQPLALGQCHDYDSPEQDERCEGPTPGVKTASSSCYKFPKGDTFERANGLLNRFGLQADGNCIDTLLPGAGDGIAYNSSGPFMCKATCNGAGKCTTAWECECLTAGNPDGGDVQCDGQLFKDMVGTGVGVQNAAGKYFCSKQCTVVEPDDSLDACKYVAGPGLYRYKASRGGDLRCCGDDSDEMIIGQACCPGSDFCMVPGGSCLGVGDISQDGKYYCAAASQLKECVPSQECQSYTSSGDVIRCNGQQWVPYFGNPEGSTCRLPFSGTPCGECHSGSCVPNPTRCSSGQCQLNSQGKLACV